MTIKKYAVPAGVTSITLPDGSVLIPVGNVVSTDNRYESELVRSGCVSDDSLYLLGIPRVLWQSGMPLVLPGGDGGANGLSFTGTRGLFTLSAAILSGVSAMLGDCYLYLPAGAGGLESSGWRWAQFSSDTAGEVFQETFTPAPGAVPPWVSSPTQQPDLTAGRITQSTSEITAASFTLPGGSMGPNGIIRWLTKQVGNSSANVKGFRLRGNGTQISYAATTTVNNDMDVDFARQNAGITSKQNSHRQGPGWIGNSATTYGSDDTAIDTSADVSITATMQLASNVDAGAVFILRQFSVTHGA